MLNGRLPRSERAPFTFRTESMAMYVAKRGAMWNRSARYVVRIEKKLWRVQPQAPAAGRYVEMTAEGEQKIKEA